MALVPIRPEDKEKSYYKYYAAGIEPMPAEDAALCETCLKDYLPGLSLNNRLLLQETESYPPVQGVYPLEEGGYVVASNIPCPDITGEMMAWWMNWHVLDPFRYCCWDPEDHYGATTDEIGRTRALDPSIPVFEKAWYSTQTVQEAMAPDTPPDTIVMRIQNPADVGFDPAKLGTPACQFLQVGKLSQTLPDGKELPLFVTLTVSQNAEGVNEVRERFWLGYDVTKDGKVVCALPAGVRIPPMEEMTKGIFAHTKKEYRNLNKILPSLYAEEKDNW